ncbi:MAG: gluconate 2-dehydrogenase subunit 3 family protein [Limnoraphis sp.]
MILSPRHLYTINHCTKYLARTNTDDRHNYNDRLNPTDLRARILEKWRFPIIDNYRNPDNPTESDYDFNQVTFVYSAIDRLDSLPQSVEIIGTFANLYEPIALDSVEFFGEATGYYALTMTIPKGEKHLYKFLVDGNIEIDPINPQLETLENGEVWSRFFTQLCTEILVLEPWQVVILQRLTDHILPFRTEEGERFLNNYYNFLDRQSKDSQYRTAYQFDESVGVVNFIDKLLAKEENHHLLDYKICLQIIDDVLRQRNPFIEPKLMSKELYIEIYNEMASDNVNGWDKDIYGSPRYFLEILRRHTFTGAFAHPKYGGNAGASAWAFLAEKYKNQETGETLFNWRQALEMPLGTSQDYLG